MFPKLHVRNVNGGFVDGNRGKMLLWPPSASVHMSTYAAWWIKTGAVTAPFWFSMDSCFYFLCAVGLLRPPPTVFGRKKEVLFFKNMTRERFHFLRCEGNRQQHSPGWHRLSGTDQMCEQHWASGPVQQWNTTEWEGAVIQPCDKTYSNTFKALTLIPIQIPHFSH